MKRFDWANIDRGYMGFEDLAIEYVKSEYPAGEEWSHTPYTQDGNKDGVAIVCGFRPHTLSSEEWWMEAKYSTKTDRLTRYRLDATIVSAAIHGNVSKIVFVTNISVSTKTIVDIRTALRQAIHCHSVHFCVKNTLEYWLTHNPDIFAQYFPDTDIHTLSVDPLFMSEGGDFFSDQKIGLSVYEPLQYVQRERAYYFYFSMYSSREQTLKLSVNNRFKGVTILSPNKIMLSAGVTPCVVKIALGRDYSMEYQLADSEKHHRNDLLDGALLRLGKQDITLEKAVGVLPAASQRLYLLSQRSNLEKIEVAYRTAKELLCPSINFLIGASGLGKTYLSDRFLREKVDPEQSVFRIAFTLHPIQNDLYIYFFLVFCLYPYLPPELVDDTYLEKLGTGMSENSVLYRASSLLKAPDCLHQLYIQATNEDIYPANLSLSPKVIVLDDLQKLDEDSLEFLLSAIAELAKKRQPIFVLASGWPEVGETSAYKKIAANAFFHEVPCRLTGADIAEAILNANVLDFKFDPKLCTVIFPNVIELLAFLKYLKGNTLQSVEDLLVQSRLFLRSDAAKTTILDRFQKLFEINAAAKELCMRIYWSVDGIPIHDPMTNVERKLIQYGLVKTDEKNTHLIPYHDLYRKFFQEKYKMSSNDSIIYWDDVYVKTAKILTIGGTQKDLEEAVDLMERWMHEGRFYAILYVLENLFETSAKDCLRQRIGSINYFRLYLCYAFGVANGSRTKSGKDAFLDIEKETTSEIEPDILMIRLRALFELINSNYEWLRHDEAERYIVEIDRLILSLQKIRKLPEDSNKCEAYILTRQIEMLISSERDELVAGELFQRLDKISADYGYAYERMFFRLRFAETLYFRATSSALSMVEECRDSLLELQGVEDKFYLWAKMDYEFLRFVLGDPNADINVMREAHSALKKNCFNDYRKRLLALAAVYYVSGLTEQGDSILFSDVSTFRELRPRQRAIYAESMALHYALSNEIAHAEKELVKAEELFADFPSYLKIIRHNHDILKMGWFSPEKITFCSEGVCAEGWYCIDPRCIW